VDTEVRRQIIVGFDKNEKGRTTIMGYNGWTNWETWNFKLWIDNDEDTYRKALNMARGKDAYQFSLALENWADNMLGELGFDFGFFADVCNTSIKEVNFYEVAESYLLEIENEVIEEVYRMKMCKKVKLSKLSPDEPLTTVMSKDV